VNRRGSYVYCCDVTLLSLLVRAGRELQTPMRPVIQMQGNTTILLPGPHEKVSVLCLLLSQYRVPLNLISGAHLGQF